MNKHWQDWGNLVLGFWILISPWALMTKGTDTAVNATTWNLYVVGIALTVFSVAALIAFQVWEEWVNLALGAWLLISPWLLGFSASALLMWNAVVIGTAVVTLVPRRNDSERFKPLPEVGVHATLDRPARVSPGLARCRTSSVPVRRRRCAGAATPRFLV